MYASDGFALAIINIIEKEKFETVRSIALFDKSIEISGQPYKANVEGVLCPPKIYHFHEFIQNLLSTRHNTSVGFLHSQIQFYR